MKGLEKLKVLNIRQDNDLKEPESLPRQLEKIHCGGLLKTEILKLLEPSLREKRTKDNHYTYTNQFYYDYQVWRTKYEEQQTTQVEIPPKQ